MRFLVFGDIHDEVERVEIVLRYAEEKYGLPRYVLITGDYGEKEETIIKVARKITDYGLEAVSVYGNHEPRIIREKVLNENSVVPLLGIKFLPLGVTYDCCGINILGVGGNRGSGKKWSHWRDSQILKIIDSVDDIDIILAHEMPFGASDHCHGKHCGQIVLRKLVEELKPKIYLGGHLHTRPEKGFIGNTVVLKVGGIANRGYLREKSFFAIVNLNDSVEIIIGEVDIKNVEKENKVKKI